MKTILLLSLFLSFACGFSQEKIPFIDHEEITGQAAETAARGDFDETLKILEKINKNDSIYCDALVSKSYYLLRLNRYDEAIEQTEEGLKRECGDSKLSFYINKGVALENQEKLSEAIETYNEALESFPVNAQLWFNKGVIFEKQGETEKAIKAYQRAIYYNPGYKNPHLKLGDIAYKQHKMAQAIMAINFYLLLEPDGENAFPVLNALNNVVSSSNSNTINPDLKISEDESSFEVIDLVLNNRLALNENYEIKNGIKVPVIKQNHILLEQLNEYEPVEGFWADTYVPLYKWISTTGRFDDFAHTLAYSIENEDYKKIVSGKTENIKKFIVDFNQKWQEILSSSRFRIAGDEGLYYSYVDSYLEGKGKYQEEKLQGEWQFYTSNGVRGAQGNFNESGKREGKWIWYHAPGKVKEIASFENGELQGENLHYFENGKPYIIAEFKDDELEGEYRLYNEAGALLQKKYFKNGELDGLYTSYFKAGEILPEFHIKYRNGNIEETALEYYANGEIFSESPYTGGIQNGEEKKYHANKNLYARVSYTNGNLEGAYTTYHSNGNLMEQGGYLNGVNEGPVKTYYADGVIESEANYEKGVINGISKNYSRKGNLHAEYEHKKGDIIGYKFYDEQGNLLKEDRKKRGEFYYTGYSPFGNLVAEGLYDISGGKKGLWKFYTDNGVLTGEGNYENDLLEGRYTEYYSNGKTKAISDYKENALHGYYSEFYKNGVLKSQGWYKEGVQHGEWRAYYIDGTLQAVNFFHKGSLHGEQENFSGEGKPVWTTVYKFGYPLKEIFFNAEGDEVEQLELVQEQSAVKVKRHHSNGKVHSETSYVNGIAHGPYIYYDFYGNKRLAGDYRNGEQDGLWTWFYKSGNPERILHYSNGQLHGEVLEYHENGEISDQSFYELGEATGTWVSFYEDGTLEMSTEYSEGQPHGRKEFYSPLGKLQLIRFYEYGRLVGYSYSDKNSEELSMIVLENESGTITAFYDNGKISREMEYLNGELVRAYRAYYYNGELENEVLFDSGDYLGKSKDYYSNGKLKKEEEYLYDHLQGPSITYYENGNKKEEVTYRNHEKNGEALYYDEEGKLIKKENYFNGEIYSMESY